jgi:thymidylate synthase (FAD)
MKVELLLAAGSDIDIVNAARVSYANESHEISWCETCQTETPWHAPGHQIIKTLNKADKGLINFLAKHRHGTPFEMVWAKFRITCPIFVAREWQRHRIASYNEVSTRYVEMQPNFYMPEAENVRTLVGKQGDYHYESVAPDIATRAQMMMHEAFYNAWQVYQNLLREGIAKEVARNVLPLALETQFITAANLRAWMNFCSLRNDDRALREIHDLAAQVEEHLNTVCPVAMQAFNEHGRHAP